MKSRRNISNDLKYTKKHFVCENYISDERSILEPIEVKGGEYLIREEVERFTLGFILSGEMDISTAGSVCQRVGEKQMFLIAAGDNFHGRAITDISLMRCSFTRDMSLCNRFPLNSYKNISR